MRRRALDQFRWFGRSLAQPKDPLTSEQVKIIIEMYAKQAYPKNLHRREWCIDNIHLFYNDKMEMLNIMRSRE